MRCLTQWAERRSNPRLRSFKPPLDHLSYQPILQCSIVPPSVVLRHKKSSVLFVTTPSLLGSKIHASMSHQGVTSERYRSFRRWQQQSLDAELMGKKNSMEAALNDGINVMDGAH